MDDESTTDKGTTRRSSSDEEPVALVMDVGGNWIRVALATNGGDLVWRDRIATQAHQSGRAVTARIEAQFDKGIAEVGSRKIVGVGLGLAGPVDHKTGTIHSPPNIPGLDGVSFKALWKDKVKCPVLVGNDATLAALGEYRYGAGVGAHTLVYLTISTGIGGGIVIGGRPMTGANGMAGELGHMSVGRDGPQCKCGNVGCLEELASGTAIAETARKLLSQHQGSTIKDLVYGNLGLVSSKTVFEAAAQGDELARDILEDVAKALGAGLVNVLHIFNPDVIIMGGGVSINHWDYLRPTVEAYIGAHVMSHVRKMGYKLVVSSLGDDIGMLGAAALVWQEVESAN